MDDPNITMEEYIRLEEEKARKHGKVSVESEFPAIAFNDELSSKTLSGEPTVSSLNNEIDFRVSFDDFDDKDYTVIFEKNSFSYKKISTNDLIMDSENDNEKVMPSLPSPKPTVSYLDDLDFFKEFENEFPAIVYNDAQTSKSDLLTEPILSPQHIDEFDLNDETSVSEYDEDEQNILYFNDLFPFNIIHPDDLKSENDNDDNDIDIIESSEGNEIIRGSNALSETSHDKINKTFRTGSSIINLNVNIVIWTYYTNEMLFYLIMNLYVLFGIPFDPKRYYKDGDCAIMLRRPRSIRQGLNFYNLCAILVDFANMALPPRDQRHLWLLYQVEGYTEEIVHDFEQRLETIFGVILEFFSTCRIGDEMGLDVARTLCYQMGGARRSMTWRQFIIALGLHTAEEMAEDGFGAYWLGSERLIPDKGDLSDYWVEISSGMGFLRGAPSYTYIRDLVWRLCHRLISYSISGRGHAEGRKSVSDDGLRGLSDVARELRFIDMGELVKLNICMYLGDDWVWVAPGPERQQVATTGTPAVTEDAPAVDEGDQAVLAPMQAPQQPPPPPLVAARTMTQRLRRLEEEVQGLRRDVGSLCGLMERSMTDQGDSPHG
ncbi:hypothetical protein Tco_1523913 [Tanacetum coccineum]